jgi:hypothetical protein
LRFRAGGEPELLRLIGRARREIRLGVQVPAIAALLGAQRLRPDGAWLADRLEGCTARDHLMVDFAGGEIGTAHLDRAGAAADRLGYLAECGAD